MSKATRMPMATYGRHGQKKLHGTKAVEFLVGAVVTTLVVVIFGAVLIGFFTEPDPFYAHGPRVQEEGK